MGQILPQSLWKERGPADTSIWDFCLHNMREYISVALRHLVCSNLYGSTRK